MRKFYQLKWKTPILLTMLLGGLTFGQVYQMTSGDLLFPGGVSDNGVVVLSSAAGNYMWTEAEGLNTLNTISNGYPNAGNPAISVDGTKISGTVTHTDTNLNTMGLYDVTTGTWTYLDGIGGESDGSVASAWSISGDGSSVVGLGWIDAGTAHAIKWTQADGTIDLGSTVTGRSSRANDASFDGSIIAGWQDAETGFRQGAIWEGGVQTLLFDGDGMELGEVAGLSADGTTAIGGGLEAWAWNAATGVTYISHPNAGMFFRGASTAISADGSIIIGYYRPWPGPPMLGEGFIWTEETGRVELNEYINSLGMDDLGITFALPLAISNDGKMIVGTGVVSGNNIVTFLIKLPTEEGNNDDCENAIAVSCGETITGDTTGANNSGGNDAGDLFYTYTGSGVNENVTVSLCGSSFDTALRIFSDCTLANEIAFNDDSCDLQSEVSFISDGTSTYIIMVEGYSTNEGEFTMNVNCEEITDYCEPVLDCTDGDLITNVTFQEINNETDCSPNGYGNYTDQVANVEAGGVYPMSVTVGSGWTYESVMVWIDFNNNFIFEPSEYYFIGSDPGTTNTAEITIPEGTEDGEYRMRVRVGAVNPDLNDLTVMACNEDTVYGETEDYTVNVGQLGISDMNSFDFAYYPNPVTDILNLNSNQSIENVSVFNLAGQKILSDLKVSNGQINVSVLPKGVYIFKVTLEKGQIETFKIVKK